MSGSLYSGERRPTAEPGVYDSLVVLGQSAAFTGPAAALGTEFRRGAMLYFDYINGEGGVHGRNIMLVSIDDGYEPDRTVVNTERLINDDHVFGLFGYIGTPTSKAALPLVDKYQVPFIAPFTGAELLRTPTNHNVFNLRASYGQETDAMVEDAVRAGLNNIAVFYQDDSYGKAGLTGVQNALEKRNLALSTTATVERNSIDVAEAVKRIKAADPDAVMMISAYSSCAEFIRRAKSEGIDARFYNVSFVGSKALATDLWLDGRGVVVSQVMPFPGDLDVPVVKEYNALLQRFAPQSPISFGSLEGFIAAKVFVKGLQDAGRDLTRERLVAAFESFGEFDVGGFKINWDPTQHQGSELVNITVIGDNHRWLY
ncbi:hypothetical protein CKO23_11930 [Thiocystis violacea]|nr:hypothetical protein [Thiocystis violacea]